MVVLGVVALAATGSAGSDDKDNLCVGVLSRLRVTHEHGRTGLGGELCFSACGVVGTGWEE